MIRISFFAIMFMAVNIGFSQTENAFYKEKMNDNSVNFYDVVKEAEAYFETIDKDKKGSGYKPFMRWKYANEYKYFPTGDRSNVDPYFVENQFTNYKKENPSNQRASSNPWIELGPNTIDSITGHYSAGLGRIEDIYVDPTNSNLLYLGSRSGGFWRSNDEGKNWVCTTDTLVATGVNTFTVSPTNADSILINVKNARNNTSFGVYMSIDGGFTWIETNFNPTNLGVGGLGSNFQILEIAYHPRIKDLVFVGTNNGLYISTDNLNSWVQVEPAYDFKELAFHPTNDSIVYTYNTAGSSTSNFLLISHDFGNTFSLSNNILGNNGNETVELVTSPQCEYCVWFGSNNGIWVSYDKGLNFKFLSNPDEACHGFAVSDIDTSYIVYGYVDLDGSSDGGRTFSDKTRWSLGNTNGGGNGNAISYKTSTDYIHADLRNAKCVNGVFYVATDGFMCKSTDNGDTWQILSEGVGTRENYCLGASQSNHHRNISGSQDNGTSILTEKGWVEFYGADGMEGIIHPLNDDYMMGSVQYGNRRLTKNGGLTQTGASPSGTDGAYWVAPLAFDPNNQMHVYDFRDSIYLSEDFASTHKTIGYPTFAGDIQIAAIAENNSKIMVVGLNSFISKSIDGGKTFTNIKGNLPGHSIRDIAFNPKDDNNIFVVYGRYQADNEKIFMTKDGGQNWTNITYNLGSLPISSIVIDHTPKANIYVGAEIGVYTKKLNETNWELYSANLPNMDARELEIINGSNTLRCATWGRGLLETSLKGREDFPKIVYTKITSPPSNNNPKVGVEQFVTSEVLYSNTLTSVYLEWSKDTAEFGNTINMKNIQGNMWKSETALPDFPEGTKLFFKVFAVGNSYDTSETYKFMYEVKPFENCFATGNDGSGNLFIENVNIENLNNSTGNDGYSKYFNPTVELFADSVYSIYVAANTGWAENDFAVWVDFNNNADFDENERVLFAPNQGKDTIATFKVPTDVAFNEVVTMRVRLSYWGQSPEPCDNQFGEVEDYEVLLRSVALSSKNETEKEGDFLIFPNPNKGDLTIQFTKNQSPYNLEILDIEGKLVYSKSNNIGNTKLNLNLPNGNYFVKVIQNKEEFTQSLIISK